MEIITSELQRVASRGLTKEELRLAKDRAIKSKLMEMQTSSSWVGFHGFKKFIQDSSWTLEDYCKDIEAVDLETIQRIAQEYFRSDKWYLAACGNIQESDIQIPW
jgi:predicted Zn-dependent peptidase